MMNKSLLNLAVLYGTVSFGQLPNASIRHTVSTTSQSAGQYYTLTGLRVGADTKGLLITGGKKIIIK